MKKFLSLLLSVLMLMSAFSVQSFAAFDFLKPQKAPSVVSVEFVDSTPVSAREVENNYMPTFFLSQSVMEYKVKITFSDGTEVEKVCVEYSVEEEEEVTISPFRIKADKKGYDYYVSTYIEKEELKQAVESKSKTVPVHITVTVLDYSGFYTEETYKYEFVEQKELVPCFVESIKPVSGLQEFFFEGASYLDLDGVAFELTYPDSSKKTVVAEKKKEYKRFDNCPKYYVDGTLLWYTMKDETGEVTFHYLDAKNSTILEVKENPIESLEVLNATLDEDFNIDTLTFAVNLKDGTRDTVEVTDGVVRLATYGDFAAYRGYKAFCFYSLDYENTRAEKGILHVHISIGDIRATGEFEIPAVTDGLPVTSFFVKLSESIFWAIAKAVTFCYAVVRKILFNDDIDDWILEL